MEKNLPWLTKRILEIENQLNLIFSIPRNPLVTPSEEDRTAAEKLNYNLHFINKLISANLAPSSLTSNPTQPESRELSSLGSRVKLLLRVSNEWALHRQLLTSPTLIDSGDSLSSVVDSCLTDNHENYDFGIEEEGEVSDHSGDCVRDEVLPRVKAEEDDNYYQYYEDDSCDVDDNEENDEEVRLEDAKEEDNSTEIDDHYELRKQGVVLKEDVGEDNVKFEYEEDYNGREAAKKSCTWMLLLLQDSFLGYFAVYRIVHYAADTRLFT